MKKYLVGAFLIFALLVLGGSAAEAAISSFNTNLSFGMKGSAEVTNLQQFLTDQGIYQGPITGNFLSQTLQAVKKFQADNGVTPVSGYFGPLTRQTANNVLLAQSDSIEGEVLGLSSSAFASLAGTAGSDGSSLQAKIDNLLKQFSYVKANFDKKRRPRPGKPTPPPAPTSTTPTPTPTSTVPNPTSTPPVVTPTSTTPTSTTPTTPTSTTPTPTSTPPVVIPTSTTPTSTTAGRLLWGAYVGNSSVNPAVFETLVGKTMDMQAVFVGWGSGIAPFPLERGATIRDKGKTMVLFWEQYGVTLDSIIAGNEDAYIAQFAAGAKAYGGPVILSPFHEMNGNWNPWGGATGSNTPAKVVAAWKKVHSAFANVPNVKFAWTVNNVSVPNTAANAIELYYPGDAYVDYVSVDGFNFGNPWQTWSQVFSSVLNKLAQYNKPIYILSTGSVPGTLKAQWISDGFGTQIKNYPLVKGWVWFNQNGADGNFLVDSDPNSLAAFRQVIPR